MHHVGQVLSAGITMVLLGLFVRLVIPRQQRGQVPSDNSWYSHFRQWVHNKLFINMGRTLSAFCMYSGVFLVILSFF